MSTTHRGTLFILLATASYGLYGIYSRLIGQSFGEFSQSWTRNTIILVILGIFIYFSKSWKKITRKDYKWMILWPLSDVVSIVLLYITFNNLSIGTSYFLLYATMIIGGFVFGKIFYKEKLSLVKVTSILLSLTGLSLIFSVEYSQEKLIFIIFGLLSGISTAAWNTLSKKVSDRYPNAQLVCIDAFVALCATLLFSLVLHDSIPPLTQSVWIWQAVYAVTQISAVAFVVLGFRYMEAQTASVIMPVELIFATVFGFLFFHEVLPTSTLFGGLLIASAAVLPNLSKRRV